MLNRTQPITTQTNIKRESNGISKKKKNNIFGINDAAVNELENGAKWAGKWRHQWPSRKRSNRINPQRGSLIIRKRKRGKLERKREKKKIQFSRWIDAGNDPHPHRIIRTGFHCRCKCFPGKRARVSAPSPPSKWAFKSISIGEWIPFLVGFQKDSWPISC